jgi:hypothetical protein
MTEAEKRRALCFLQLESQAQESKLMANLGVSRFGNDVLMIVDLPAEAPGSAPAKVSASGQKGGERHG